MRICQLNPYYFPYAGGIERRIHEIGKRLAKRHDVTVLTSQIPGTPTEETVDGLRIHRLPSRYFLRKFWNPPLVKTPRVLEGLRRIRPDIVDYHYRWAPAYARAFVASRSFSRLVFTYHNTYGEGAGLLRTASLLNDWWTKRFIKKAHRIVAISRFIRDDLVRRRFPPGRLSIVPNGIDAAALEKEAKEGEIPPGTPDRYVIAVGRLVPTKGLDLVVRALPQLPADVHALILGQGPERERLERLARKLGVADRVHLPGWVKEADKLRLLKDALAFVHPAHFESFGLAVLEAMAMGAPIVATHVGGLPEVVGDAGPLVPPRDVDALATAIRAFAEDDATRKSAREKSRARARQLTWDAAAKQLERVYDEVLQAPLSPPHPAASPTGTSLALDESAR